MIFHETKLSGVYLIEIEPNYDERGFFARTWCRDEARRHGLCQNFVQSSLSFNKSKATVRGLHIQVAPFEEVKLIRCINGEVFEVVLDLRPESPSFKKWQTFQFEAKDLKLLYLPQGVAHGFQTLRDGTCLDYQISASFQADHSEGIFWKDPELNIRWPIQESVIISKRDQNLKTLQEYLEQRGQR